MTLNVLLITPWALVSKASRIAGWYGKKPSVLNFRRTNHALAQVLNELVRSIAVPLAGTVADDRAG